MKITFRWYGENDGVTLDQIRQIPVVSGVVAALYDVPAGEVWSEKSIEKTAALCREKGLGFEVVESVPVREDIKLGLPSAKGYIENYKENIRRLAKYGIKCICYNFMPVFDWLRSDLNARKADGSTALSYRHSEVLRLDPLTSDLSLPGWDASYPRGELKDLLTRYSTVSEERLWDNLETFLKEIIPVASECGVKMAIHPDDPPWGIFGLPRIITGAESVKRLLRITDDPVNGITFCVGSFGAAKENNLFEIAEAAKGRIHFAHFRNVKRSGERDFEETAHPSECGDIDMFGLLKKLLDDGFSGYIRPDHGRMIWGEKGRPGYGLFDRALGACYIAGMYEAWKGTRERRHCGG
ncbi:MAG: mannonate dehydratase [Clostridiales bacterium]|jgi:mannonate dehydratase|nr:mannonate dehydratase [Clostridiales bacterium]